MKTVRVLISLAIVALGIILLPSVALADDSSTPTSSPSPEKVEVNPKYPKMEGIAGSSLTFEVELDYTGNNTKVFDLQLLPPNGWEAYINPQYDTSTKISSVSLTPTLESGTATTTINVVVNIPSLPPPDPGDYKITLTVNAGTVKGSADLTAIVMPQYSLVLTSAADENNATSASQLATTAQAGKDNAYSIAVQNLGTATIDNIGFSSTEPEGWTVSFTPNTIDSLPAADEASIDVHIKPDAKATPGDYIVSLTASGTQASAQKVDVRVTVATSSIWNWAQVGIVFVVVIGLILVFMRYSRR